MKKYSTFFFFFLSICVYGQDSHFSQFYAAPLALNPALTGMSTSKIKATAQYRNQWKSVTVPFQTMQTSVEAMLFNGHSFLSNDFLGIGGYIVNNEAGSAQYQNPEVRLSAAYHKSLDNDNRNYLSAGLQYGLGQRSINGDLTFNSQFDGSIFNINIPSGEIVDNEQVMYQDIGIGISYALHHDAQSKFYIGLAGFHLNRPNISFLNNRIDLLDRKIAAYAGGSFPIADKVTMVLQGVYLKQGAFRELNFGLLLKYNLVPTHYGSSESDVALVFGTTHRLADAQIFVARIDTKSFSIGVSYDANISSLKSSSNTFGGYELSFVYQFGEVDAGGVGCPVF